MEIVANEPSTQFLRELCLISTLYVRIEIKKSYQPFHEKYVRKILKVDFMQAVIIIVQDTRIELHNPTTVLIDGSLKTFRNFEEFSKADKFT